jgi:hypothetical protein
MASGVGGVTTDITSQIHAAGGPKANKLREGIAEKVEKRDDASQVLKINQKEDLQQRAAPPGQRQDGQDQSKMVSEMDRVQISSDIAGQAAVARQSDARINARDSSVPDSSISVREKNRHQFEKPDEMQSEESQTPREHQAEMMEGLNHTPTSEGNGLGQTERSLAGSGFGGYTNRAVGGLGGYAESVETSAKIDQDHPLNETGPKARIEAASEDRPKETAPGQLESEVGKTIDKMI